MDTVAEYAGLQFLHSGARWAWWADVSDVSLSAKLKKDLDVLETYGVVQQILRFFLPPASRDSLLNGLIVSRNLSARH